MSLEETVYSVVNMFQVINQEGQSNLVKAFPVLHGEFLTSFKRNFIARNGKISALDT